MSASLLVLAGIGLLSVALIAIFAAIVIGIQRGDHQRRGHLFNTPESYSDALSRRLLIGVRHSSQTSEENDK
jgi:hypothetical protein